MRYPALVVAMLLFLAATLPTCAQTMPGQNLQGPSMWTHQSPMNTNGMFRFAVISDVNGGERPGVLEHAVDALNLLQPEFVMCIGDLIGGYLTDERILNTQYDSVEARLAKLQMPFHYTAGNHDISNNVELKLYQQRYGTPYSYFIYQNVLFLCLDTNDPPNSGHLGDEQIAYFTKILADNPGVRWTMVFMHHPIWKYKDSNWDKFATALQGRKYTVFAGHEHVYRSAVLDGQQYFILSTTGGAEAQRGPAMGEFDHLVWITMTDKGPVISNILLDGILKSTIRDEASAKVIDSAVSSGIASCTPIEMKEETCGKASTQLKLSNNSEMPMHIVGHFRTPPTVSIMPGSIDTVIAPRQKQIIDAAIVGKAAMGVEDLTGLAFQYTVNFTPSNAAPITVNQQSAPVNVVRKYESLLCARAEKSVTVDGKLDEWTTLPYHAGRPADPATGKSSSAFRFATAYDDQFVYLAVKVEDDQVIVDHNGYPWGQDGLELRVNACADPGRSQWRGSMGARKEELLIPLSPGNTPAETVCLEWGERPKNLQVACVKTPTGYNVEIAIPVSYLNAQQQKAWDAFRINIALDDADANGQYTQTWWYPDWRSALTIPGSGTFTRK